MSVQLNPHSAFTLDRKIFIEALDVEVAIYTHQKTKAQHIHIAADHSEKVAMLLLRTVPQDDRGAAHILEHTALCGSARYPVRDPFFMMIRRSLNTFMNAFTSSDWTAYPFATQNDKDFDHLLAVYLDAVFFARLDPLDFAQEGHRLAFNPAGDVKGDLCYKGVVFNEMKGAMSAPTSMLWQQVTRYLLPDTTYHYNSGGDPYHIPDLSYEQLKAFYTQYYHPTNAVFMTFGSMPVVKLQQQFETLVLHHFDYQPDYITTIAGQKPFAAPVRIECAYASAVDSEQTHIVSAWMLGNSHTIDDLLLASLVADALLDHSGCPLMAALESTSLAKSPSPLCGVSDDCKQLIFIAGSAGSEPKHAQAIYQLVDSTLAQVVKDGIPYERLVAALHQIELSRKEITGGQYPYGLQLLMTMIPGVVHHDDPIALIDLDQSLAQLSHSIKDPEFIKTSIQRLLLDNPHRVNLVMKPDTSYSAQMQSHERLILAKIKAKLNAKEKQAIVDRNQRLDKRQTEVESPTCLPNLLKSDIPEDFYFATGLHHVQQQPWHFYGQGTNGLVYQDVIFPMPDLTLQEFSSLAYLLLMIGDLGCGKRDYQAMQAWQNEVCAGVWASVQLGGQAADLTQITGCIQLSTKALLQRYSESLPCLTAYMRDMIFTESAHIKEIIAQHRQSVEQSLTYRGHTLAMLAAGSYHGSYAYWMHCTQGLLAIKQLKEDEQRLGDQAFFKPWLAAISDLYTRCFSQPHEVMLVAQASAQKKVLGDLTAKWQHIDGQVDRTVQLMQNVQYKADKQQVWLIDADVSFCAKAYAAVPIADPDAAALNLLALVLRNGFLHTAIREQGGAYGGGASYDCNALRRRDANNRWAYGPRAKHRTNDRRHQRASPRNHRAAATCDSTCGAARALACGPPSAAPVDRPAFSGRPPRRSAMHLASLHVPRARGRRVVGLRSLLHCDHRSGPVRPRNNARWTSLPRRAPALGAPCLRRLAHEAARFVIT